MKRTLRRALALLLALLLLTSGAAPAGLAADLDPAPADTEDGGTVLLPEEEIDDGGIHVEGGGEEDAFFDGLRPFYGAAWSWLQLELDRSLLEQVGRQTRGVACACYALAYCRTILDGEKRLYSEFNLGTGLEDAWCGWFLGNYDSINYTDASDVFERCYQELCAGRPTVLHVKGTETVQHYITVVGFENVENGRELDTYSFLVLDPCAADFRPRNMGELGYDLKRLDDGNYQILCDTLDEAAGFEAHRSSYLSRCTVYHTARLFRVSGEVAVCELPDAAFAYAPARTLERSCFFFLATDLIRNPAGEYWLRGTNRSGEAVYVRASALRGGLPLCEGPLLDGAEPPDTLKQGEPLALNGTVSAEQPILRLRAEIRDAGSGALLRSAETEPASGSCALTESGLAEALHAETLAPGDYALILRADYRSYYSPDGKTLCKADCACRLLSVDLRVAPSDGAKD